MIVTVVNSKGGCTKTTTIATLARLWSDRRPLVLDTDTQQAVSKFKLPKAKVLPCAPDGVTTALQTAKNSLILIDCPPDASLSRQAIKAAHLIIIPTSCEPLELDASCELLEVLNAGKHPRARLLLTRYVASHRTDAETTAARYGDWVFTQRINRAALIVEASRHNLTVLDTAPESLAARQYTKLGTEIQTLWQ